jgi:thioesterase domain-containing protein
MTADTTSSMMEMLTPIWERVLRRSPISVDENFFDLGGDSGSAQNLTTQVAQTCGRVLPPAAICYAPTISALSAMLERPEARPLPPLVLLKSGMPRSGFPDSEKPPVLITHGIGGSALDLVNLARRTETPQAIYGMQTRGLDGIEEPFDRIEDIAQGYIDALEQIQPHGPYFLIGYSLGGLVTLEMAQRLRARGEKIGMLAMLDSYPDLHQLLPGQRALLTLRLGRRRVATILDSAFHRRQSQVLQPGTGIHHLTSYPLAQASENVRRRSYVALRHYRPRFFDGTIKFVSAEIGTNFPENPVAVWAHLTRDFQVETAPGNHLEMLTLHFETLAGMLSRYLKEIS